METLNLLLNEILETKNKKSTGEEGLKIYNDILEKLSEKDKATFIVFHYFFPKSPSFDTNSKEFWFMKYKNDEHYNEYKFCVGLLKCYKEYLTDKDYKNFELKIVENIKLFKNSKYISELFSVANNYEQRIFATVAYITKDSSYFEDEFGIFETPENIQKISFIKKSKIISKKRKKHFL